MVNLKTLPEEELAAMVDTTSKYLRKLENEQKRRRTLLEAEDDLDELALKYFKALGISEGEPWSGPSSAIEGYPNEWETVHEGGMWKSLVAGNLDEPGETDAWERIGDDPRRLSAPSETALLGEAVLLFESTDEEEEDDEMNGIDDLTVEEDEGLPGEDDA